MAVRQLYIVPLAVPWQKIYVEKQNSFLSET